MKHTATKGMTQPVVRLAASSTSTMKMAPRITSHFSGTAIASLAGALTPGGPMIGFAIGVAALKSGAGAPQVIAYSTAWALFAIHRLVIWEVPMMPARVVWLRALVSLPLPFLAAGLAILLGRP